MTHRRRKALVLSLVGAFAVVLLNVIAAMHAWSMVHFDSHAARTKAPEELSGLEKCRVLLTGVHLPHPRNSTLPFERGLVATTVHLRTVDGLDLEAWWIRSPHPKGAVALFHGYASTKSALLEEAKALHDLGYSTLLVDQRGHGGSQGDLTSIGYREAEDVRAAVEFLRRNGAGTSTIFLFGRSMGGVSILRALSTHAVEVSGVVVEGVYDEMLNAIRNRFRSMGLPAFPLAELLGFWGGVELGFPVWRHDPVDYAAEIRAPVLLLHGTDDPRATLTQARRVFAALQGRKELVEFGGTKHESLCTASPERWRQAVAAFLEGCGSR